MERKNITTNLYREKVTGSSSLVRIGNQIHIAGTAATNAQGKIIGLGDPYTQTKQIFKNIESALFLAGGSINDVVRTRIYATNIDYWQIIGKAHCECLADNQPVTSMVEVRRFTSPEILVEIEADAVVDPNQPGLED